MSGVIHHITHQGAHIFYGAAIAYGLAWYLTKKGQQVARWLNLAAAVSYVALGYAVKELWEGELSRGGRFVDFLFGLAGALTGVWLYYRLRMRGK